MPKLSKGAGLINARRTLATASTREVPPSVHSVSSYFEGEPGRPNVITDIPGPKVLAAKAEMGKIQDVFSGM